MPGWVTTILEQVLNYKVFIISIFIVKLLPLDHYIYKGAYVLFDQLKLENFLFRLKLSAGIYQQSSSHCSG